MQNSKLSDIAGMVRGAPLNSAAQKMQGVSEKEFARHMREIASAAEDVTSDEKKEVAQKFAGVFYSMLFKTMQETIPDEDNSAISSGMKGLIGRYIPRVMANTSSDPISRYIEKNLDLEGDEMGGDINEQA